MTPQGRTRAILASSLDAESRLVAIALADHLSADDDEAWPSVERLAAQTALAERTVRHVLAFGRVSGWLAARDVAGGSTRYTIKWPALAAVPNRTAGGRKGGAPCPPGAAPRAGRRPVQGRAAPRAPLPGAPCPPTPAPRAPEVDHRKETREGDQGRRGAHAPHAPQAAPPPLRSTTASPEPPSATEPDAARALEKRTPPPPPARSPAATGPTEGGSPPLPDDLPAFLGGALHVATRLASAGILTPAAVLALTPAELRRRPGIGPGTVAMIEARCRVYGVALAADPARPPPPEDPRLRAVTDEFAGAWRDVKRIPPGERGYPWSLGKGGTDRRHRAPIATAADLDPTDPASLRRLRRACTAYLEAALSGRAWPYGEPPTFARFAAAASSWLQVADGHAPPRNGHAALKPTAEELYGPLPGTRSSAIDTDYEEVS